MSFTATKIITFLFAITCAFNQINAQAFQLLYDLDNPDQTLILDTELQEISGLSITSSQKKLVAVQDELAKIYILNKDNGKIEMTYNFGNPGDFEGIEIIANQVFVAKSNGQLYVIDHFFSEDTKVKVIKTGLNRHSDLEGLGFDPKQNCLLIVCKETQSTNQQNKRHIYAYNIESQSLDPDPSYFISKENILKYLNTIPDGKSETIKKRFLTDSQKLEFSPSAIAMHPLTGHIYILSSKGKMMLVLNLDNTILKIKKLDKTIHTQPEGIAFDIKGNLYISNEGKEGRAKIYRFDHP